MPSRAAQLSDAVLAAQAVEYDPDLLLSRIALARCSANVLDELF